MFLITTEDDDGDVEENRANDGNEIEAANVINLGFLSKKKKNSLGFLTISEV